MIEYDSANSTGLIPQQLFTKSDDLTKTVYVSSAGVALGSLLDQSTTNTFSISHDGISSDHADGVQFHSHASFNNNEIRNLGSHHYSGSITIKDSYGHEIRSGTKNMYLTSKNDIFLNGLSVNQMRADVDLISANGSQITQLQNDFNEAVSRIEALEAQNTSLNSQLQTLQEQMAVLYQNLYDVQI